VPGKFYILNIIGTEIGRNFYKVPVGGGTSLVNQLAYFIVVQGPVKIVF
jgi:hypothetical protein